MVNSQITADAVVPDQLIHYVAAVSGLESRPCGACVLHIIEDTGVLVAYPMSDPLNLAEINKAVNLALATPGLKNITVLSSQSVDSMPTDAYQQKDMYWSLTLPLAEPAGKLKNMLKRASRDVIVDSATGFSAWTQEHKNLVEEFCRRKNETLNEGSKFLFRKLDSYLAASPDVLLFSARSKNSELAACAIGDFSAFSTAFYMFAFRGDQAPPGSADLLLYAICQEAEKRGHSRINLGLGIDGGVEFFKKKWGAIPWLPYVETSWQIKQKSWLRRIFKR